MILMPPQTVASASDEHHLSLTQRPPFLVLLVILMLLGILVFLFLVFLFLLVTLNGCDNGDDDDDEAVEDFCFHNTVDLKNNENEGENETRIEEQSKVYPKSVENEDSADDVPLPSEQY